MITYTTVCSGIEAMSAAVKPFRRKPLFFSEVAPFAPPFQFAVPFYRWCLRVTIVFQRWWPQTVMGDSVTVTVV